MYLKDRYKAFLRTLRMWRHIRMTKRGGRSYDPAGINGTSPGELAVLCPVCPIPSVNLPPNWQSAGQDTEYVGSLCHCSFSRTSFPGTSIISHSALMPAFDLRGGRSQTMRRTLSWVLGMHTSLHGIHTASIFVASPISRRFVSFVL